MSDDGRDVPPPAGDENPTRIGPLAGKGTDPGPRPKAPEGTGSHRRIDVPTVDLPEDAPRTIGRYRLIRELGRGGMGVVYLAVDDGIPRLVALKVLPSDLAGETEMIERFRREQEAVLHLEHPGIVSVFDVGTDAGCHYYVMRYVDGLRLDEHARRLRRAVLPAEPSEPAESGTKLARGARRAAASPAVASPADLVGTDGTDAIGQILQIFETVARALDFAHGQGVLHRDIKPSNIMIDGDGNPHLMDFGLAKLDSEGSLTQSGRLMGTIPYMSPEQVATKRIGIDHRTDVYSLGVALYECLTGLRPFRGGAEDLMFQILMRLPPPMRETVPEISEDIEVVVARCLEKNPERRFQTALELAEELARIRAHQQIESEPVGPFGRLLRWVDRNRFLAAAILGTLVVALAALGFILHSRLDEERAWRADAAVYLQQAEDATRDLASTEARLADVSRRLVTAPAEDLLGRLQLEKELEETRLSIADLRDRAERRFARSIETHATDEAMSARESFYFRWMLAAEAAGDSPRAEALGRRLAGGPFADRIEPIGRLNLETRPSGVRVSARPLVDRADGRRLPDDSATLELGRSPLREQPLRAGSWILTLSPEGLPPVDYPVLIERDEVWGEKGWHGGIFDDRDWTVDLVPMRGLNPEVWRLVPGGPFQSTATPGQLGRRPGLRWDWEAGFVIARDETSFADWFEYLEETRDRRRNEAPAAPFTAVPDHPRTHLKGRAVARFSGDARGEQSPMEGAPADFEPERYPVAGISAAEIRTMLAWWSASDGERYDLPSARQWEKAARGVDGRPFPWGFGFDWSFTAGRPSSATPLTDGGWPLPAQAFPVDRSPYGLRNLAGNVAEWCRDGPAAAAGNLWIAGGDRSQGRVERFVTWPVIAAAPEDWGDLVGFRVVRLGSD